MNSYYPGDAFVDDVGLDEYGAPIGSDDGPSAVSSGSADVELQQLMTFASRRITNHSLCPKPVQITRHSRPIWQARLRLAELPCISLRSGIAILPEMDVSSMAMPRTRTGMGERYCAIALAVRIIGWGLQRIEFRIKFGSGNWLRQFGNR